MGPRQGKPTPHCRRKFACNPGDVRQQSLQAAFSVGVPGTKRVGNGCVGFAIFVQSRNQTFFFSRHSQAALARHHLVKETDTPEGIQAGPYGKWRKAHEERTPLDELGFERSRAQQDRYAMVPWHTPRGLYREAQRRAAKPGRPKLTSCRDLCGRDQTGPCSTASGPRKIELGPI